MSAGGDASGVSVAFETTRENLPAVLGLAAEVLQQPAFPADQLDEIKRQRLAQIDSSRTEPQPLATQAERRYLSPYAAGDFRYVPTFDEQAAAVSKVTAQELQAVPSALLWCFQRGGRAGGQLRCRRRDKSVAAVVRVLEELQPVRASARRCTSRPSRKTETIETPDKANAVFFSGGTLQSA